MAVTVFEQPAPFHRLAAVRITAGLVVLVLLAIEFDARFYVEVAPYAYHPLFGIPMLSHGAFVALELAIAGLAVALVLGVGGRPARIALAVLYAVLFYYDKRTGTVVNAANVHVMTFLALLCVGEPSRAWAIRTRAPSGGDRARTIAVLALLQVCVVTIYVQGFVAKWLLGGPAWFTGAGIRIDALVFDHPIGVWCAAHPALFPIFAIGTGVLEASIPILFVLGRRWHRPMALGAIAFHTGTWLVLGISFWRLWIFYPALFLIAPRDDQRGGG